MCFGAWRGIGVIPQSRRRLSERYRAYDARAVIIGQVTEQHRGVVVTRTMIGGARVVDRPIGELLARVC